ncbi:MAG TPA: hypothetical protein DCD99_08810 [Acinetobacter schindleri]|nr:hypothetical protein [Acinetobacter schindleri]
MSFYSAAFSKRVQNLEFTFQYLILHINLAYMALGQIDVKEQDIPVKEQHGSDTNKENILIGT